MKSGIVWIIPEHEKGEFSPPPFLPVNKFS
jgi:hypothetical protein